MKPTPRSLVLLAGVLALAACGGSSSSSSGGNVTPPPPGATTRGVSGAITAANPAAHTITVNNKTVVVQGATIVDDTVHVGEDRLATGTVVTVRGAFAADDRTGTATHVEIEHGLQGRVDDKGTDFVRVGGQVVHVDDTTHFDDSRGLGGISAGPSGTGTVVRVSGVPDDKGGLRASRIDRSLSDDSFDVKGFVSSLSGSTFQLRLSPDAVAYWIVDASGVTLPAGLANGAFVEVHAASTPAAGTAPVLGTITASRIELEDRFGESEVEVEGIVTSGSSARFVVDGVTVTTSSSTRWELGTPADLVPGVKVEAEGQLSGDTLAAEKVSFRPGARLTAVIDAVAADSSSITMLGMRVQTPSFMDNDFGPLVAGARVEVRGNPSADGSGLVATRVTNPSGGSNDTRVLLRAVATDKSNAGAMTFTVMGFTVTTSGASFKGPSTVSGQDGLQISATDFFNQVEAGRTVLKVRAPTASDVSVANHTFAADELEIEGNDG